MCCILQGFECGVQKSAHFLSCFMMFFCMRASHSIAFDKVLCGEASRVQYLCCFTMFSASEAPTVLYFTKFYVRGVSNV